MKYSLILPAYNEEKHIRKNLQVLSTVRKRRINEIIVVNDGSTDHTADIVNSFLKRRIKLLNLPKNIGKTAAVLEGVKVAKHEHLIFYDADLQNMKRQYVEEMLDRYEAGADMVVMHKDSAPFFFRKVIQSLPANSGTRVICKSLFNTIPLDPTKSWALEAFINNYFLEHNLYMDFVSAPGVYDPRKFIKYPFFQGLYLDIKSFFEIVTLFGLDGIPKNLGIMREIHRQFEDWKKHDDSAYPETQPLASDS